MASRKLVRDMALLGQPLFVHLRPHQQLLNSRLRSIPVYGHSGDRQFSVVREFVKKIKGEASSNKEFQQSVEKFKEAAEGMKGVTGAARNWTKQTSEQVRTEAEATAKMVSASAKEKINAAREEFKEHFGIGKEEHSTNQDGGAKAGNTGASSAEENGQQSSSSNDTESIFKDFKSVFDNLKSSTFSASPKISSTFEKLKDVEAVDLVKKGFDIVKDELNDTPTNRRKHMEAAAPTHTGETSTRTDVVVQAFKKSRWSKTWEAFKEKMQGHPMFRRARSMSEPVVTKSQEIAEDVREVWETTDNPVVHKIQDWNDSISQETGVAATMMEIRRREPSFSLPEFVEEVQELVQPVLIAHKKCNVETLNKYCTPEVVERCKAERNAFQSHDIFFDDKILHVFELEVVDRKMMGTSPVIILRFLSQQTYCVRDKNGVVKEGGKDTIVLVLHDWAMKQIAPEELGGGAIYPVWKICEMRQQGQQTLI